MRIEKGSSISKPKPYTRTGDKGETSTAEGRESKDSLMIEVLGSIDELVAFIGLARSKLTSNKDINELLRGVQRMLFRYAAVLHGMKNYSISNDDVAWLEEKTLSYDASLPRLTKFVLPGESETSALIHVARTVCRRTERRIVSLSKEKELPETAIPIINRLSSLLFVLARYVTYKESKTEEYV